MDTEARTYTLRELTDAAGVSARTVRYYITEGLLPPPHGMGPASVYTEEHLERLRQIAALKAAYLPLKEIRRRLLGHGHELHRHILTEDLVESPPEPEHRRSSAADYLRGLRERGVSYEPDATAASTPPPMAPLPSMPHLDRHDSRSVRFPGAGEPDHAAPEVAWRRLRIDEEAELLISDDLYRRRRDKVDWLIEWARRVLRE